MIVICVFSFSRPSEFVYQIRLITLSFCFYVKLFYRVVSYQFTKAKLWGTSFLSSQPPTHAPRIASFPGPQDARMDPG